VAMVNPFDLTTVNMTRIDSFNLYLPRRVFFSLEEKMPLSLKNRLYFNDYLLHYENEDECMRRIYDSIGLKASLPMKSYELIKQKDLEAKIN